MTHHHGGHRRSGGGRGYFGPVYVGVPDCDPFYDPYCRVYAASVGAEFGCTTEESVAKFAGDILPTFVTPTDAQNYIRETDASWIRLAADVANSQVSDQVKESWNQDLAGWTQFRDKNLTDVGWLNTKAVMDQTDRWLLKAGQWKDTLSKAGVTVIGPSPLQPDQGDPNKKSPLTPYLIGGGIAATLLIGVSLITRK